MPAPTPRLTTDRLALDPLRVEDAEELAGVLADPALYTVIGGEPPSVDRLRDRFARMLAGPDDPAHEWHNWTLRRLDDGVAVGTAQSTVEPPVAWLAWVVGTPWQRRGYATEAAAAAAGWLRGREGLRVTASIAPGHTPSESVARRTGLVPTGRFDADGEQEWVDPVR